MKTRTRVMIVIVTGLFTVAFAVVFGARFGADPRLSPSPLIGGPAPEITLDLVDGEGSLSLSDLAGDILIVNFWAPWCAPCRAEHADLIEIASGYDSFGVTVVGVVYQSRLSNVIDFLDELGRGYPVGMDDRSRAAIAFGIRGVPETFFVDRDGTVVAKISGAINLELAAATLDRIIVGDPVESTKTGEVQTAP